MLHGLWKLSSPTRMEPTSLAVKAWSPNHWATREFPVCSHFLEVGTGNCHGYSLVIVELTSSTQWVFQYLKAKAFKKKLKSFGLSEPQ